MIRVLIYLAAVVLLALGVVWMADHPGTVLITFGGREIETSTLMGAIALLVWPPWSSRSSGASCSSSFGCRR